MSDLLNLALDEHLQLTKRLQALEALIAAYGGHIPTQRVNAVVGIQAASARRNESGAKNRSEKTETIIAFVKQYLIEHGPHPVPTRSLREAVEGKGIAIGGQNPQSTLSAILSHADDFTSIGRQGWVLASPKTDTPPVSDENGGVLE